MSNSICKLQLALEYGQEPLWMYDDEGFVIDVGIPPEWGENKELSDALLELSDRYDELFINDPREFRYVGFKDETDRKAFKELVERVVTLVTTINNNKYPLEIAIDISSL